MDIITKILEFRGAARRFFQKYQLVIEPVFRFVMAYIAFHTINNSLHYNARLASPVIELGLALFGAFLPPVILILFCGVLAIAQVYCASPILAALVVVIFAVLYCFIARFSGKYGYAVVAIPILFPFHIPYLIPLLLGMIATPMAVFPTVCGVIVYYVFKVIKEAALRQDITSLDATLALYIDVVDSLAGHKEMFVTAAIFAVIIIVMCLLRKLRFEFVFEITIAIGAVVCIIGFLLADLQLDIGGEIGTMILGTVGSMLLVYIAQFFRMVLDYTSVEHVQFEDDDYYYYVKAVPKIDVAMPQRNITRFGRQDETEEAAAEEEFPFEEEDEQQQ
ncbi:MAG: hypothetical protein ACI4FZ_03370 [Lachnospiraceae bacterium]